MARSDRQSRREARRKSRQDKKKSTPSLGAPVVTKSEAKKSTGPVTVAPSKIKTGSIKDIVSSSRSSGGGSVSSGATSSQSDRDRKAAEEIARKQVEARERTQKEFAESQRKKQEERIKQEQAIRDEQKRIQLERQRIIREGGRERKQTFKDSKTGDEIEVSTLKIDAIRNGSKIEKTIETRTNLKTGQVTTRTFDRGRATGGLSSQKFKKEDLQSIKDSLPLGEELLFDPGTNEPKGIRSKILGQSIPFTQEGIDFYNKQIENVAGIKKKVLGITPVEKVFGTTLKQKALKIVSKREDLRGQLKVIQDERKSRLNKIDSDRRVEIKKVNATTLSQSEKKKIIVDINLKALEKGDVVKRELDPKGIEIQNKLLAETGKGIVLGTVLLTKEIAELGLKGAKEVVLFGKDLAQKDKTRQNTFNIIKQIPKFTYDVATGAFKVGRSFGESAEVRQKTSSALKTFFKTQTEEFSNLLRVSPAEALLLVGGEILIMQGTGKALKVVGKAGNTTLKGTVKIAGKTVGKIPYLKAAIRVAGTPVKIISKARSNIVNIIKRTGRKALDTAEKKIRKLKVVKKVIKIKKKIKKALPEKRRIEGVKVSKKEWKSFKEAKNEFDKLKRISKFVKKAESKGGIGLSQEIKPRPISTNEIRLLRGIKGVPKSWANNAGGVRVTTLSQKFISDVPVIKRFGDLKKGFYRIVFEEKPFFQNTISYTFFNKQGKALGSASFNIIANKPLAKFRSVETALRYGSGKSLIISKQTGKKFISSLLLSADKRIKPAINEFITKFKVNKTPGVFASGRGEIALTKGFSEIRAITKKVARLDRFKKASKKFKVSPRVSKSILQSKVSRQKLKTATKEGIVEIKQSAKKIDKLLLASKVEPVVIETKRITRFIEKANNLINNTKSVIKKRRLKRNVAELRKALKKTKGKLPSKTKISNAKYKQILKIEKELNKQFSLKSALSSASIPPKVRLRIRVKGLKELKKLQRQKNLINKAMKKAIANKVLSASAKVAFLSALKAIEQLEKTIKGSLQETDKDKLNDIISKLKTDELSATAKLSVIAKKTKTLLTPQRAIPVRPRPRIKTVKKKKKKIIVPRKKKKVLMRTLAKATDVYFVSIKVAGKLKKIPTPPMLKTDARDFLAYQLDNKLQRTAKLLKVGKAKKVLVLPKKIKGYYAKNKQKLRPYMITRGVKKGLPSGKYIEKKKYVGDTVSEQVLLQKSRKKKVVKKKVVKKKASKKKTKNRKKK